MSSVNNNELNQTSGSLVEWDSTQTNFVEVHDSIENDVRQPVPSDQRRIIDAITVFIRQLASIEEGEYGDWMRRANNYWIDLEEMIGTFPEAADLQPDLDHIRSKIQFYPDFRLENSRQLIIALALQLRDRLDKNDHLEAPDFAVSAIAPDEQRAWSH